MAIRYPTNYDKIADIPADLEDMAESIQDELDLKVDKVTGKSLSTNDYTDDEKSKLAGIATGAEVNVIETVKVNGTVLTPSNKAVDVSVPTKTSDLNNDSGFIDKDVNNLTNYYDKNAVDTKISAVYKYKGTVSTYADLPSTNLTIGDVYNIETADSTHGVKAGDNVAWNGTAWDVLAGTVDLSGYQTKIDSSHKLESDLVDDTNSTHKFVTSEEKTQISTNATDIDNIKDGTEIDSFGDVETALAEKQAEIDDLVTENSTLRKQIPTAHISTTSTQLTDSAEDLPIEHVKIKGATSQVQYEGRNKLRNSLSILQTNNTSGIWNDNKYVLNDVTFTVNNDLSITANGTASQNVSFYVNRTGNYETTNLSAGTYYLTSHETTGSNSTWKLQYSVGGNNYNIFGTGSNQEVEVTLTEESTVVATIIVYAEKTVNNVAFYPMISTSSGTDYEKYVGGQPAPNPAYPQLIHRVTGECNEKVQNKNLLEITADSRLKNCSYVSGANTNEYKLLCTANDMYVNEIRAVGVSYTSTNGNLIPCSYGETIYFDIGNSLFTKNFFCEYDENFVSLGYSQLSLSNGTYTPTHATCKYVTLRFGYGTGSTEGTTYTLAPIVCKTSDTSYIPHAEQNAPLSLGNIEAYEGDEIQIDYVQKAGYKKVVGARLVSIMGYYTFTGEENFSKSSNTNVDKYTLSGIKIPNVIKDINIPTNRYTATIFCSHFEKAVSTTYDSNAKVFYINSGPQLIFNFAEYGTTTVEDFKQFLAENQVKVAIKQNNPVTTEITDQTLLAQLETLINMKTYKNITNIESTGADLAPVLDCDYYQDMSTLNDRLDELEARIELLEE